MKKVDLPIPSERLIGFTIPRDGLFYVLDHDEVWKVVIGPPLSIELTDFHPYAFVDGRDDFVGWGRDKIPPILKNEDTDISFDFDPRADFVTVKYSVRGEEGQIEFPTFSGDWFSASLAIDGHHLVLAEPYRLELFEVA